MKVKSEKAIISAKDYGSKTNLENNLTMTKDTPNQSKFQLDLFSGKKPRKTFEIIHCCNCQRHRELDGYQFKLMPICSDCRAERHLEVHSNRIERRKKR
jgi:hypothetical protein